MSVEPPLIRDILNGTLNSRIEKSQFASPFSDSQLSAAEKNAGVTPNNYSYSNNVNGYMNVFRFFTDAQVASAVAQDSLVDMTLAIQAANDFLEGRVTAGTGGSNHPGGTLYFPAGLYNINPSLLAANTLRVGAYVRWLGDRERSSYLNSTNKAFGGNLISLGPGASGFWSFDGIYTVGSCIEDMHIGLFPDNSHGVIIYSAGAHQFCRLKNIFIQGVNQIGIGIDGAGGPAYTILEGEIEMSAGNTEGLAVVRQGIYYTAGSILQADILSIEGSPGHLFDIGVRIFNGSLTARTLHFEAVTTGVYFDAGGTNAVSTIDSINGNSSCTQLVWIPTGYTGGITCLSINARTGDPTHPIGIRNDVTGEQVMDVMHSIYVWSGTAKDIGKLHNTFITCAGNLITYSASMTPNCVLGNNFYISVSTGAAFTINAPLIPINGMKITFGIFNSAGGVMGAVTWNAVFKLAAWISPANGFNRSITFLYDGGHWYEISRTTVDVPN